MDTTECYYNQCPINISSFSLRLITNFAFQNSTLSQSSMDLPSPFLKVPKIGIHPGHSWCSSLTKKNMLGFLQEDVYWSSESTISKLSYLLIRGLDLSMNSTGKGPAMTNCMLAIVPISQNGRLTYPIPPSNFLWLRTIIRSPNPVREKLWKAFHTWVSWAKSTWKTLKSSWDVLKNVCPVSRSFSCQS